MKSRRRVNSTVIAPPTQEWKSSCAAQLRVVVFRARLVADDVVWWGRRANQSLDASRTSGLLIDNLRVTQLRAAASTQPLTRRQLKSENRLRRELCGYAFSARLDAGASAWWRRRANQSLDASRASGLLIDNLRVTQLRAAASTPPFGGSHDLARRCLHNSRGL